MFKPAIAFEPALNAVQKTLQAKRDRERDQNISLPLIDRSNTQALSLVPHRKQKKKVHFAKDVPIARQKSRLKGKKVLLSGKPRR